MTHSGEQVLFRSPLFVVGEFVCPPADLRWQETNAVSDAPHLVFPRTSVVIAQAGREPVLANRNHVMFYNPSQRFRRVLHDARGDVCVFLEVEPGLLAEVLGREPRFDFAHAPADPETYLLQDTVTRSLRSARADALCVEEVLLDVVRRSLERGVVFNGVRRRRPRARTELDHAEIVEAVKAALTATPSRRVTLAELARRVYASPFHLARVFRERTGFSIHDYQTQLRLRLALDALHDGREIGDVALELGFSSHSHFTSVFRSSFGGPPSAVRGLGSRGLRERGVARRLARHGLGRGDGRRRANRCGDEPRRRACGGRGGPADGSVASDGGVWFPLLTANRLVEIDPASNSVVADVAVGDGPFVVNEAFGDLWVGSWRGADVWRLRP
jgi:AraC family transcriptional regulator